MPNLTEIAAAVKQTARPEGTWSLLIYGPPKSGKTALAATIAKVPYIRNVYYFDIENGRETLITMTREGKLPKEATDKVTVYKISDTKQVPMAMETIMKVLTVREDHIICDNHGKVNCVACATKNEKGDPSVFNGQHFNLKNCTDEDVVIIDSGSQFGDSVLNYYLRGKSQDYKAGWDEYGPQGIVLTDAMMVIQNARTNFIMCTHEIAVERKENDVKVDRFYPLVGTKNFSMKVAKYFSHVAYVELKMGLHKGGTKTDYRQDTVTGSRANWLLESCKNPDLSLLFEQLRGKTK